MGNSLACRLVLVGAFVALGVPDVAGARAIEVVNAVRGKGCGGEGSPALGHVATLDVAAQRVAEGKTLRQAVDSAGYRAVSSALLFFDGARDDNELARLVAQSCAQVTRAGLRDAGYYQRGRAVWIVLAEPFTLPALDKAVIGRRIVELVNRARAQARRCGNEDFAAAPPLRWSAALERAAGGHARDMAERGAMSHTGRDGSTPPQRTTRAGYAWSATGENIAAGQRDAESVVKSWLTSPGHCANLMNADYTEVGVAFATNPASEAGVYWAQVFGAPLGAQPPRTSGPGRR
jgi:hypothetical protein